MCPIYEYACEKCGRHQDAFRKMDDRGNSPICCGEKTKQVIGGYSVHSDIEPYLDANISSKPVWVKSKQHRKQLMKENGVFENYGRGWK